MGDANLIIAVNQKPTFEEFLSALGIKGMGLGAQLFEVVYWDFFLNAPDLKVQYKRYYSVEYSTFEKYLEACHDLKLDDADIEKEFILKIKSLPSVLDEGYENNQLEAVLSVIKRWE